MAFQAEQKIKADILRSLSTEQLFRLLSDSDLNVLMKTLGLLRNLLSTRPVSNAPRILHCSASVHEYNAVHSREASSHMGLQCSGNCHHHCLHGGSPSLPGARCMPALACQLILSAQIIVS